MLNLEKKTNLQAKINKSCNSWKKLAVLKKK